MPIRLPSTALSVGDGSSISQIPAPGSPNLKASGDARVAYLVSQAPLARTTTYFIDAAGSDSNDGRDAFGFGISGGAYTAATKTLTKTGAFSSYVYQTGDRVYISGGTNMTAGLYTIASRVSDDAITLETAAGSANSINVTTSSGPWLSVAKVQANLGDDIAFLFKRGGVFRDSTGIDFAGTNVTFGAYGNGPKPRISCFDTPVTTGASWTSDTGTTYYRTRAAASVVGAFREAYDAERAYVRCSTVTECRLIKGSYFHDTGANRLYVNAIDGADLTTSGLPYTFEICGTVEVNGIRWTTASSGSLRVDNLIIEGYGSRHTSAQNSCYGIQTQTTGTAVTVCTDCECYYNNNHNFGHTSAGTGGIALFKDCKAAWMNFNGTCFVGYSNTTGNECYVVNCEAWGGTLPRNTGGTWSYTYGVSASDFYTAHSNGDVAMSYLSGCTVRPNQFGLQAFGAAANVPDATSDISACRSYMLDCKYLCRTPSALDQNLVVSAGRPGTGTRGLQPVNITDKGSTVHINCHYQILPVWETTNQVVGGTDRCEGIFINTTIEVDGSWSGHGDTSGAWARGLVRYMGNLEARFYNCHIQINEPHKLNCGLSAQCAYENTLSDNNVDDDFRMFDTVLQINCPNGTAYFGCGNNRLRADGTVNATSKVKNIVTNVPYSTDTYRGNDKCTNLVFKGWTIGQVPIVGEVDAVLNALPGGTFVGHDKYWNPRRSGTSAIGPVEAK